MMARLLIASDVRLFSDGITGILASRDDCEIVGVAASMDAAVSSLAHTSPDVVLLDQAMVSSLETLQAIRRLRPEMRVVVLGVPAQEDTLLSWAENGMSGFVPRDASIDDLIATIASVIRGEFRCNPRTAATLLRRLAWRATASVSATERSPLTARETEIVGLIDQGLTNKEIAQQLGIEVATVKNHVHNVLEKLRVRRRAEAAARLRA